MTWFGPGVTVGLTVVVDFGEIVEPYHTIEVNKTASMTRAKIVLFCKPLPTLLNASGITF